MKNIPVTEHEEVVKSREAYLNSRLNYRSTYYNYLNTILSDIGFRNKLVQLNSDGTKGTFKLIETFQYAMCPYTIQFYPCRKDGTISAKYKYIPNLINMWDEAHIADNLKRKARVVGDLP